MVLIKAITLLKYKIINKDRKSVNSPSVQRPGFFPTSVSMVFMVAEGQWDRSVSVLQLSVASVSPPMYHSHLRICHQHQIISQTDSVIK